MGVLFWGMLGLALLGCSLPRDASGTLSRVRGGTLRVGVSENPPCVRFEGEEVKGVEPALLRRWAEHLGAGIEWVRGSEAELVKALERRELDVIAFGLTDKTPWSKQLGMTRPYLRAQLCVGRLQGVPLDWKGQAVAVEAGEARLAALVRQKGGRPVYPPEDKRGVFRAGYDFELVADGLLPTGPSLAKERHVFAVAPGESAFLLALDRFLQGMGEAAIFRLATEDAHR